MIEVSILTQDFIIYEIALQTRKLKSKYVKTQDQIANIFTKPLKYDVFFNQNERCVGSYKEIKFKGGC